jgi:hypothetical protein
MEESNKNVQFLQDEIINTIERCRTECENLTIVEVLGVLEMVKLSAFDTTFKKD